MNINDIPGRKWRKDYFNLLIDPYIPYNIDIYVELFAGSFRVSERLKSNKNRNINTLVYNDINIYDGISDLNVDHIDHLDYKECIKKWDSLNTFFYIDPPYYGKEDLYNGCIKNNKIFHIELKEILNNIKGDFIINYEAVPFIFNLYNGYNIYSNMKYNDITIIKNK